MATTQLELPMEKIAEFCRRWKITELALFGSALQDDFGPESDVDLLVSFAPDARGGLFAFVEMQDELSALRGGPSHYDHWRSNKAPIARVPGIAS